MNIAKLNVFGLRLLSCIISIQLLGAPAVQAEIEEKNISTLAIASTGPELEKMMDLSVRIMLHKTFYKLINDTFGPLIQTSPTAKNLVSQSKIIFILSKVKDEWSVIEQYLKKVPEDKVAEPDIEAIREKYHEIFDKIISNKKLIELMRTTGAASQPLMIVDKSSKDSYKDMEFYANHPRKELGNDGKLHLTLADDHRQIMIDFVNSAKSGDKLYFNFYDFDLEDLAEAFAQAQKRGVEVLGGVDKKVIEEKPAAKAVYTKLKKAKIQIEAVDSVGLNHQKMMALISKNGVSRSLMSSGNPTQSCSGPEGDLIEIPANIRPKTSIPNPNNMIIVEGDIPAIIAAAEIRKNIIYKLRGQDEFPIGGAYQLLGPTRAGYKTQDWMIMAFSPNGGLDDINRDVYSKMIELSTGPIRGAFFSISSEPLALEMTQKIVELIKLRRKQNKPATDLVKFIGDSQFAMRDFSILLRLSGYRLVEYDPKDPMKPIVRNTVKDPEEPGSSDKTDTVKVYIKDLNDPISKPIRDLLNKAEWENFQENIRINAAWFRESSFEYQGKKYPFAVKLHNKLILFLKDFMSNVGSSVNFSGAGKANQEQIMLVFSEHITKKANAVIDYLFDVYSSPDRSVSKEVERRNRDNTPEQIKIGLEVFKKEQEEENKKQKSAEKNKTPENKSLQGLTCPMVFAR